jgi:hypothetical protein
MLALIAWVKIRKYMKAKAKKEQSDEQEQRLTSYKGRGVQGNISEMEWKRQAHMATHVLKARCRRRRRERDTIRATSMDGNSRPESEVQTKVT